MKSKLLISWLTNVYMYSVGLKFMSTFVMFANSILLARLLGVSELGIYAYFISMAGLISALGNIAIPQILVRETARYWSAGDLSILKRIWYWAALTFLSAFSLWTLFIVLFSLIFSQEPDQNYIIPLLVSAGIFGLSGFLYMLGAVIRGAGRHLIGQIPVLMLQPALFSIFLLILLLKPGATTTVINALMANFASVVFALAISILIIVILSPRIRFPGQASPKTPRPRVWNSLFHHGTVSIFQYINANIAIVLLVALGTEAEAGIFRVAVTLSAIVLMPLQAINATINPRIASYFFKDRKPELQSMLKQSLIITVALSSVIGFSLVLLGKWIIEKAYGVEFAPAYSLICILVVSNFLSSAFGSVGSILNMTGNERETAKTVVFASILTIILNLALIPILGAIGGAISTMLATLFWNIRMWYVIRSRLGIKCAIIDYL